VTELHAQIDLLEGELTESLVGRGAALSKRAFAVLQLERGDGTTGLGEASPLPGYSPDSMAEASIANPLASPFELLVETFARHPLTHPASRFALETALLDWLGHTRGEPLHQILGGDAKRQPIPIADLVMEASPASWPACADALLAGGATHLKLKVGADLDAELASLKAIRQTHPTLPLRLDGNGRIPFEALRAHAGSLEALELELFEEPVAPEEWPAALDLPLPYALDESLRDAELSERLLGSGGIRAVVIITHFRWTNRESGHGRACACASNRARRGPRLASRARALAASSYRRDLRPTDRGARCARVGASLRRGPGCMS